VPTGSAFTKRFIKIFEDHDVTTFYSLGGSRKKQRSLNDVEQRILYSYSVVQVLHVQNLFEDPVHSL
jgi:hypothetical protein